MGNDTRPQQEKEHSFADDRARLLDIAQGKLPAVVAEWDDGDHHIRAVLDNTGSNSEAVIVEDAAAGIRPLYLTIEEMHTDKLGRDSWRRWDSYGNDAIVRGMVVEMIPGRWITEVRHG